MCQFGAVLRFFCIKFGYYNTKDWKAARYADPIVDTWADFVGAAGAVLFAPDSEKAALTEKVVAVGKKFNMIVEKNLSHHKGKWAAGNNIGIADFVMAAYIGNFGMNPESPFAPQLKADYDETPLFKQYAMNIMQEFTYLKSRGSVGPF